MVGGPVRCTELEGTTLPVINPVGRVERAVTGHHVNVPAAVHGGPHAARPNRTITAIGRGVEDADLLQVGGIIAEEPAVVRRPVAMRARRPGTRRCSCNSNAVGRFQLVQGIKGIGPPDAAVARAKRSGLDDDRPAEFFLAGEDVRNACSR